MENYYSMMVGLSTIIFRVKMFSQSAAGYKIVIEIGVYKSTK